MQVSVWGYEGKMGSKVVSLLEGGYGGCELCDCFDKDNSVISGKKPDGVIDFSSYKNVENTLRYAESENIPIVICTTGHGETEMEIIRSASKSIPVLLTANTSMSMAMTVKLLRTAYASMPSSQIEIVEEHHAGKKDSPGGTAKWIAEELTKVDPETRTVYGRTGQRGRKEIGICSLRIGNTVGKHTVIMDIGDERLSVTHEVFSREVFSKGAIDCIKRLAGKPNGLYKMEDL